MSDVSSVCKLIAALLAFALMAGATGTLIDLHREAKANASHAFHLGLMSYGRWNRQLLNEKADRRSK